jgi:hypothetical protein
LNGKQYFGKMEIVLEVEANLSGCTVMLVAVDGEWKEGGGGGEQNGAG